MDNNTPNSNNNKGENQQDIMISRKKPTPGNAQAGNSPENRSVMRNSNAPAGDRYVSRPPATGSNPPSAAPREGNVQRTVRQSGNDQNTKPFDTVNPSVQNQNRNILRNPSSGSDDGTDIYVPRKSSENPVYGKRPTQSQQILKQMYENSGEAAEAPVRPAPIPVSRKKPPANTPAQTAKTAPGKPAKKKRKKSAVISVLLLFVFILGASAAIAAYTISCVNDILAINAPSDVVSVTISEDMTTAEVISILKDKNLIKNETFCVLAAKFRKFKDNNYKAGIYELKASMGLESMLFLVKGAHASDKTKTLVFPEGYTIDQIAEKLEKYNVCTKENFYASIDQFDFSKDFPFLQGIQNKADRYRVLEGYIFPDTYNFYIGENATSVITKFLTNFKTHWTDAMDAKAKKLNMSIDQIVILASIIQKEAYDKEQMTMISSILHNRLNDKSGKFEYLGCDSTGDYIYNSKKDTMTTARYDLLRHNYDTYQSKGFPPGAVANPGDDALNAALNPENTKYLYFRHDKNGKIYRATTQEQHDSYQREIEAINKRP